MVAWRRGDEQALERLIPLVYRELHRVAKAAMRGERRGHTLEPTALVNEAYMRLVDLRRLEWQNRAHFLAVSARLMRRILIDHARAHRYQKRGGGAVKVTLEGHIAVSSEPGRDLVALDDALEALSRVDERKSRVVELRFFGGMTVEETATVMSVSVDTIIRDRKLAKAWLLRELRGARPPGTLTLMRDASTASERRGLLGSERCAIAAIK